MAEGDDNRPKIVPLPDGHEITYNLKFHGLDDINRTFNPLQFDTGCLTAATSWRIELTCERRLEVNGDYDFSIRLRRIDHLAKPVNASLEVFILTFAKSGLPTVHKIKSSRDGIVYDDELSGNESMVPIESKDVVDVDVIMNVKFCHVDNQEEVYIKDGD